MNPEQQRQDALNVVEQFFSALEAMDMERFFALWHDDAQQAMPFAPEGFPHRLDGIGAIRRQYGGLPDAYTGMEFPRTLHLLVEPGWVLAEYSGTIMLKAGGEYNNTYIGLFEIKDGRIWRFHEYFNPIVLQQAFGDQVGQTFSLPDEG